MNSQSVVTDLLEKAGIEVNGSKPWDPQIHDPRVYNMAVARGSLGVGEAYMSGLWDCEDLPGFFERCLRADLGGTLTGRSISNLGTFLKSKVSDRFSKKRAFEEGEVHYNLPTELWEATLDSRMTGSCAYYPLGTESLDEAQTKKNDLVIRKSGLPQGGSILDIGVGWGSVSGRAIETHDARPVGYTIASEQARYINGRYGSAIDARVDDFRNIKLDEPVDAVVSLEMFEHVGRPYWRDFFEVAHRSLKPDGRLVLHTIVRHVPQDEIDAWQQKYIYVNGCLPTPGQVCSAVHGLFHLEDVHDIGAHYPATLGSWMSNFRRHWADLVKLGPDKFGGMDPEVACRMWEYHYDQCNGGFRTRDISVQQFVFSPLGIPGGLGAIR